jgi:extracellular factor (EF) 3-hydroxypalmitic acid methyl ester biosynthesis protein
MEQMSVATPNDASPSTVRFHPLDPRFVAFTGDLADDMAAMRAIVDARTFVEEPIAITAARLFAPFARWLDEHLESLGALVAPMSVEERAAHGRFFRERLRHFTEESEFLKRTNDRPRGYAGDSELMRMLYDPDFRGSSVFGALLHHHPARTAAAQAVRHRVGLVADVIGKHPAAGTRPLRALSLACGPARELRHLVTSASDAQALELVLADQDEEALLEACDEIARVDRAIGVPIKARTEQLSVRDVLAGKGPDLGTFDVIYTLGLLDYLPEAVAGRLVSRLAAKLRPGGTLMVGNFHVSCATRAYLDVWMDWPLLYRTEEELLALASDVEGASKEIERDPSGSQMFLRITLQS